MSYIAKRHVPPTCEYCGKPAAPWQGRERCFAGSRLWFRGCHTQCLLKDTYGAALQDHHANVFLQMIRPVDPDRFKGGFYHLPIAFRVT